MTLKLRRWADGSAEILEVNGTAPNPSLRNPLPRSRHSSPRRRNDPQYPRDVILTQPGVAIGRAEQAGADVNFANGSGQTALMFAALMPFPPAAFDFLPYA